jgi:hypothetical protein
MKTVKIIFISSIVLLLTTTPIFASPDVSKNTPSATLYISNYNSLGNLTLIHDPGLNHLIKEKGVRVYYEKPSGNPNLNYYFPQNETGYVFLNFTLHIKHHINDIPIYWAKLIWPTSFRYSMVEVWINYNHYDYCIANKTVSCYKPTWDYFDMNITYNTPLLTNNQTLQCLFGYDVWALYTPIPFIHLICERFLGQYNQTTIFIHPIQT